MDKANRNFDPKRATRDARGNITAKNQHGLDSTGNPRKSAREAKLSAFERDLLRTKRKAN